MKTNREKLLGCLPQTPPGVSRAVERAFAQIRREAEPPRRYARRLSFGTVVLIVLLLAAIAAAATLLTHNVFKMTLGEAPRQGSSLIQRDLAKQRFGQWDMEVKEAAYDGMSLYVVYSIRDRSAAQPLGDAGGDGIRYVSGSRTEAMERDGVGWWTDHLWIDGKCVDVPNLSGSVAVGSKTPGELLFYWVFRLDQENVFLDGKSVEIALPIGRRQGELMRSQTSGAFEKPPEGLVAFRLDCSIREGVTVTQPRLALDLPALHAQVSQAVYTPIQLYVTLEAQGKQAAADPRQEPLRAWAENLLLVDRNGETIFDAMEGFYGYQGMEGENLWHYTFPYKESYPSEMYLAPLAGDGESCDMAEAVRVR